MDNVNRKIPFLVFALLNFGGIIGSYGDYNGYYFIKIYWMLMSIVSLFFMIYLFLKYMNSNCKNNHKWTYCKEFTLWNGGIYLVNDNSFEFIWFDKACLCVFYVGSAVVLFLSMFRVGVIVVGSLYHSEYGIIRRLLKVMTIDCKNLRLAY